MSGPGMSATHLTLVQDPVSPVAPSDWGIPSPGAPQSGTGAAAVPVAAIVVPVVLATALAAVSGAWVAAAWRRRRGGQLRHTVCRQRSRRHQMGLLVLTCFTSRTKTQRWWLIRCPLQQQPGANRCSS
jgi:hypothetical protein